MTAARTDTWARVLCYGVERAEERLAAAISKAGRDDCWEVIGGLIANGYGRIKLSGQHVLAHRLAWVLAHRREPGEDLICHTCDNRRCCNPAHLWLGTPLHNHLDMVLKGRRAVQTGKRNRVRGTKLTKEQAAAIRADRRSVKDIAAEYCVNVSTIRSIQKGEMWSDKFVGSHVPADRQRSRSKVAGWPAVPPGLARNDLLHVDRSKL